MNHDLLDSPTWQRELDIYRFEQLQPLTALGVKVNPLLATVDCVYRFPNGDVEIYTLERVASPEGDYLQWWRSHNGWLHDVNDGCMPFGYSTLINALGTQADAAPFLTLLTAGPLPWLADIGYALDRIIPLTRFLQFEYPKVYWLILASGRMCIRDTRLITREVLARCLCVPALSGGQLRALRKLYMEECTGASRSLERAVTIIVRHWLRIKPLIVHEPAIAARELLFLDTLASHGDAIRDCRWFTYQMAVNWFGLPGNARHYSDDDKALECLFLVEWFALVVSGIKPQHLHSDIEMERVFIAETDRLIHAPDRTDTKRNVFMYRLLSHIDPALHVSCEYRYDELTSDIRYNKEESVYYPDATQFKAARAMHREGFTHITTAGELRAIAAALQNCAALRVMEGVEGSAEFWRYHDATSGELALLQIDVDLYPSADCVVEFNGYANEGVSENARQALRQWLLSQAKPIT